MSTSQSSAWIVWLTIIHSNTHSIVDVGFAVSRGYNAIMVVIDYFSKQTHFVPTKPPLTTLQVAKLFFKHIFKYPGMLADIVSNRYPHFTTLFRQELFNLLDTHAHPQTDGQTKRVNHRLEDYIRCYVRADQTDWVDNVDKQEFCYNAAIHSSIGLELSSK